MNWVISQLPYSKKQTAMIRRKFTQEEDSKLCQLVNQYGAKKWDQIAKMMPGRTGRQCRDRYRNYLIPGFFNGQWSQEEDELLHEKYKQMGRQWARMMQFFPGRSANSLKNRWNYFVCRLNQEKKQSEGTADINVDVKKMGKDKNEIQEKPNNYSPNSKIVNDETSLKVVQNNDIINNNEKPNKNVSNNELITNIPFSVNLQNQVMQDDNQINKESHEITQQEPEERIIYGVNVSTQTDENDLIEHEKLMKMV